MQPLLPDCLGRRLQRSVWGIASAALLAAAGVSGAETSEAVRLFRQGDYENALAVAAANRDGSPHEEEWWRTEAESQLALGRYVQAQSTVSESLKLLRGSIRLRLLGMETARFAGVPAEAEQYLLELRAIVVNRSRYVRDVASLVDVGEAALLLGVEPRLVLENFFKRGRENAPPVRDAFLATGRLALSKNDDGLASRTFQQGIAAFPDDPEMWAGLAAAFLDGDRSKLIEYAAHALELNPRHVPARVLIAEHLIDAEDYAGATTELKTALETNAKHPDALALSAVLAELRNQPAEAQRLREAALQTWTDNPRVDHLIGRKLSHKYRFTEGAAHQEKALEMDAAYTPATMQLAQDLLRLGREDQGWDLATAVHNADGYNATAYNLTTLRDRIASFTILETPHFRLRMSAREAAIYGKRALNLLEEARRQLTEKYGIALDQPTTIEIYPNPKDFAVRTFGMPDNPGFLGVCFGPVVTINSPATRRANWEAVLWHEFTHVITLTLTRNRMPRWLSEGISVYEETLRDPAWGQRMTLDYRERILAGRTQPISAMSSAFLQAEDGKDLQFAYYQSYLVVRFLAEQHGFEKIRALLAALATGEEANAALAANIGPIDKLDAAYAGFARGIAREFGAGLDLTGPGGDALAAAIARLSPRSFFGQLEKANAEIEAGNWQAARTHLETIIEAGGYIPGEHNPHALLARACRELGDLEGERAALITIVGHESDALDSVGRLLAIAQEAGDQEAAVKWADRWLAINPLAPTPWRSLLTAHESRDAAAAAEVGSVLLKLDPPDRPAIHYRVGRAQQQFDPDAARVSALLALEEAPRFRAAHELLAALPPGPGLDSSEPEPEPQTR